MLKLTLLIAAFLMLGGSSIRAAATYTVTLGENGMNTVSQAVQLVTGNANLWRNPRVRVYNLRGKLVGKTRQQMRHLRSGTNIKISGSLVPASKLMFSRPQNAADICGRINVKFCASRLLLFNSGINRTAIEWVVPTYFPAIPQPAVAPPLTQPPAKLRIIRVTVPRSWLSYWETLASFIVLAILAGLLALFYQRWRAMREDLADCRANPHRPRPGQNRGFAPRQFSGLSVEETTIIEERAGSNQESAPKAPPPETKPKMAANERLSADPNTQAAETPDLPNIAEPPPDPPLEQRAYTRKLRQALNRTPKEELLQKLETALLSQGVYADKIAHEHWPEAEITVKTGDLAATNRALTAIRPLLTPQAPRTTFTGGQAVLTVRFLQPELI